jgi:hypothetical protein
MPSISEPDTPSKILPRMGTRSTIPRMGTRSTKVTPELQSIAAHRNFGAALRGDAASNEPPMLTRAGHRSVKNMRQTTNISNTVTETPAKKIRTSSQSGTTSSVSNIHSADDSNNDVCPTLNGLDEGGLDELESFFQNHSHDDSAVSTETAVPASAAAAANIAGELEFRPNGGGEPPPPPWNGGVAPEPLNAGVPPAPPPPEPLIGNLERYSSSKGSHIK